jgi:hypothetical protein
MRIIAKAKVTPTQNTPENKLRVIRKVFCIITKIRLKKHNVSPTPNDNSKPIHLSKNDIDLSKP